MFRLERQLGGSLGEVVESMRAVGQRCQWKKRISWEAGVNADSQACPRVVESAGLKGKGRFGDSAVGGAVKHSLVLGFPGEESASVEGRRTAQRAAGRGEPPGGSWGGTRRAFILDLMRGPDSTFVIPTWAARLLPKLKKAFGDGVGERVNCVESSQSV